MACSRGAAHPNAHTQKKLFAASAGYCQNPSCNQDLFHDLPSGKSIHIAEMAHVFAATDGGPRSNAKLSKDERGAYENLILLCATCHTKVDKAPVDYPDSDIFRWKHEHAARLRRIFGAVPRETRSEVLSDIQPLLRENKAIFTAYGPHIETANNPEAGDAERWKRKMLSKIIPNNNRILGILDINANHLFDWERDVVEQFRQHIDDLQARHIEGFTDGASQFPIKMNQVLESEE